MNPAGPIADWAGPIRILVSATRPPIEIDVICEKLKTKFPERGEPKLIPMGSVGAKLTQILGGNADLYINTGGFYEWDIAAPAAIAAAHGLTACDIEGADLVFNQENVYVPTAIIGHPHLVSAITEVQR
jgi:3'(2'), 5'-bisphosphate nucleotidase